MKKLLLLLLCFSMLSCDKSNTKLVKDNFRDYIEKNGDDPSSYEAVEIKLIDTITVSDFAEIIFHEELVDIELLDSRIKSYEGRLKSVPEKSRAEVKKMISGLKEKKYLASDVYKDVLSNKGILYFDFQHKFRMNQNGSPKLFIYSIITNPDFSIAAVIPADSPELAKEIMEKLKKDFMEAHGIAL